ncbi:hypothetical protein [Mycoplasma sp. 4423]
MKIKCSELNWTHIDQLMQSDEISQQDKNIINIYKKTFEESFKDNLANNYLEQDVDDIFNYIIHERIKEKKVPFLFIKKDYIDSLNKKIIEAQELNEAINPKDIEKAIAIQKEYKKNDNEYVLIKKEGLEFFDWTELKSKFYFINSENFFENTFKDEYNIPFSLVIDNFKETIKENIFNERKNKLNTDYKKIIEKDKTKENYEHLLIDPTIYIKLFKNQELINWKLTKLEDVIIEDIRLEQKKIKKDIRKKDIFNTFFDSITPLYNKWKMFNDDIQIYGEDLMVEKIENSEIFRRYKNRKIQDSYIYKKNDYFKMVEKDIKDNGIFSKYLLVWNDMASVKKSILDNPKIDYVMPLIVEKNEEDKKIDNFESFYSYERKDNEHFEFHKISDKELTDTVWENNINTSNFLTYYYDEKNEEQKEKIKEEVNKMELS